jgi:hypothetical protein
MQMMIQDELERRRAWWRELGGGHAVYHVSPQKLRRMGLYGGQQGIWVDKNRTQKLTDDGYGVAVSVLHKGEIYPDDFDETAVIYHYPKTNRPPSRDIGEIEAVKNCSKCNLPIFVIRVSPDDARLRDIFWGHVTFWNDESEAFIIEFGVSPQDIGKIETKDTFHVREESRKSEYTAYGRPNQTAFRISTIRRYGTTCAVCDINIVDLLDAAHLVPKTESGSDDPRNGIVLCCLHHRAFDRGMFAINPETLSITPHPRGPSLQRLGIKRKDISHLINLPHEDALSVAWELWRNKIGT